MKQLLVCLIAALLVGCAAKHEERRERQPLALSSARADSNLDSSDETTTTAPAERAERQRQRFEQSLRKIEPTLRGDPVRLQQYVQLFAKDAVTDPRLFAFDVKAEQGSAGAVVLTGHVEFREHREGLEKILAALGFGKIENRIEVLPDKSLGETSYGFVRVPSTYLYDKSAAPRRPVSEAVLADPLYLLKETGDGYFLCHSAEGYLGYVAVGDVMRVTAKEFHAYQDGSQAYLLQDFRADGMRLPAGSRMRVVNTSASKVTVKTPMGETVAIPTPEVEVGDPRPSHHMNRMIDTAMRLMGSKYVWGGKNSGGVDCSGLVQTMFKAHGINLPRDADQQVLVGSLVATRWDRSGMRRGDLVFFLGRNGRVHHVGVYLGDKTYLEAAGEKVKITGLFPGAPNYDVKRDESFCFAKRLLE